MSLEHTRVISDMYPHIEPQEKSETKISKVNIIVQKNLNRHIS